MQRLSAVHSTSGDACSAGRTVRRRTPALLLAMLALAVAAVACSADDGSDGGGDPGQAPGPAAAADPAADAVEQLGYASTGWATLHGDPANRKYQPDATAAAAYDSSSALADTSVLAAPSSGIDGQLYVTTGLPEGSANLHAFDREGDLLWESEPWVGDTGIDPCALLNTPVVDDDGDLYVSDCDQLWSYTPEGDVAWVVDLPAPPPDSPYADSALRPNSFLTAALVGEDRVAGITLYGQVVVADRETGELVAEVLDLPSVPSVRAEDPPLPPGALGNGEVDPQIIDLVWQVAFGGSVVSANTPALSADGRLFVVAGADDPTTGVVYGLDVGDDGVEIAFETAVGVGSGCSPTLSPDEGALYTCDAEGTLYALSTDDGEVRWSVDDAEAEAGSVAVGPDGAIYLLVRNGTYRAYEPDGTLRWDADFSTLADPLPDNDEVGPKVLVGAGNPTVIDGGERLIAALNRGYQYEIAGRTPNIPVLAELVELDAATGEALQTLTPLANPTEGIIHVDPDGTIVSSQGAITTSSLASLSPRIDPLLTDGLTVIPPGGGLQIFRPT